MSGFEVMLRNLLFISALQCLNTITDAKKRKETVRSVRARGAVSKVRGKGGAVS